MMRLLPRYIRNMGFLRGMTNWLSVEFLGREKVRAPGISSDLKLRKGTSDRKVYREIFLFGDYNYDLGKPGIIVDLGANIGLASILFAHNYEGCRIIALEPDQGNFDQLLANVMDYPNIIPLHAGIWYDDTELEIKDPSTDAWMRTASASQGGSIRGMSMSTLLTECGIQWIDVLKVDIEGMEKELFSHNTKWLDKVGMILIELHDGMVPGCASSFFHALSGRTYSMDVYKGLIVVKFN